MSLSPDNETQKKLTSSRAFPAAERDRVYVRVVETYEMAIFSGEIEVGSRLPSEADIAKDFGISLRSRSARHFMFSRQRD